MSILNSVFTGASGNYIICDIPVNFVADGEGTGVFGNGIFGRTVELLLNNSAVKFLTLGYLHVFIHEMGHALAAKLHGQTPMIDVYTQTCRGCTMGCDGSRFTALAGPLAGVSLEVIKLVGAVALATLLPSVIGLPLAFLTGSGAAFWLFGELMYALTGQGDWETITG